MPSFVNNELNKNKLNEYSDETKSSIYKDLSLLLENMKGSDYNKKKISGGKEEATNPSITMDKNKKPRNNDLDSDENQDNKYISNINKGTSFGGGKKLRTRTKQKTKTKSKSKSRSKSRPRSKSKSKTKSKSRSRSKTNTNTNSTSTSKTKKKSRSKKNMSRSNKESFISILTKLRKHVQGSICKDYKFTNTGAYVSVLSRKLKENNMDLDKCKKKYDDKQYVKQFIKEYELRVNELNEKKKSKEKKTKVKRKKKSSM